MNAAIGHEKVHLKGENDYFLFDECNLGYIFGYLDVPKLLKKYNFPDWEKKLENEYETAKELARFHRQCVNLIAYHEASNEETKNWILLSPYINDEVLDFINEKKDESGKFTKKK